MRSRDYLLRLEESGIPVVLVDRTGAASVAAAKALKKAGFEKIHVLDGGLPAWTAADLPLVKGRN